MNFLLGVCWFLSVPKSTFPTPNSIEFGAGKVHFGFGFAECLVAGVVLLPHLARGTTNHPPQTTRHKPPPPTAAGAMGIPIPVPRPPTTNHHHSRALENLFCRRPSRPPGKNATVKNGKLRKSAKTLAKASKSSKIQVKIQLNPRKSQQIQLNDLPE